MGRTCRPAYSRDDRCLAAVYTDIVGLKSVHTFENDTGPDDANHAQHGMFVVHNPGGKRNGKIEGAHIMDCAPTILSLIDVPLPDDMRGKVIDSMLRIKPKCHLTYIRES